MEGLDPKQAAEVQALNAHGKERYGTLRQRMPLNYSVATAHKKALEGAQEHQSFRAKHPFPGDKRKAGK
jgi:hypothetical protein